MRRKARSRNRQPSEIQGYIEGLPERSAILATLDAAGSPCNIGELAERFDLFDKPSLNALKRRLSAMARDGDVVRTRGARFGIATRMELIAGEILAHADGYAFVRPDDGGEDIYLSRREARRTLHGDHVLVRIAGLDRRNRPYGNLVEVLERANSEIVGRYFRERGVGYVVPDNSSINQDVLIPAGSGAKARSGQVVVAAIEQQPDQHTQPIGRVVEVLGEHGAPGMEVEIAIRSYGLPAAWPAAVLDEVARVSEKVSAAEAAARRDLCDLAFVTIDGADARDFDDAVYARRTAKGFMLYVAIADVAHYVEAGCAVDQEAVVRGTSVYFPDRVIPMLPEALSNGICSLNAHVDRCAMICELNIGTDGSVRRSRFYAGVIRSHARLIYEQVQAWREGGRACATLDDCSVAANVDCLYAVYAALRQRREQRGALDIDTVEPRFEFDGAGKIAAIRATQRVDTHRLIEECMIAANVAAAGYLLRNKRSALFRVHEPPDEEKIDDLTSFLRKLGLSFCGGPDAAPRDFARILEQARERPDKRLIDTVLLRTMKLAQYSDSNTGHFGLALEAYTHFTSPIRRYPDLVVHRAIKQALARNAQMPEWAEHMAALGTQCSTTERRAEEATREAVAWLKCEYMLDKVGERFAGIVSAVLEFGIFVELEEIFIEGLVHVTALPADYYHYDAVHHTLSGRSTGAAFGIGQVVEIIVQRVDLDQRKLDFALVAPPAPRRRKRHAR